MSKQPNRVKKVLDWEELEKAPNTRGAFSFLKADVVSIRKHDSSILLELPEKGEKESLGARLDLVAKRTRGYLPRRCTTVQHGHSNGESVLYGALWTKASLELIAADGTPSTKLIVIGWRTMARLANMTDKNCKRNTKSLIGKLAMEIVDPHNVSIRKPTKYRLFSFRAILAARKDAGLEWVVRSKGVQFVNKDGSSLPAKESSCFPGGTCYLPTIKEATTVVEITPVTVAETTTVSQTKYLHTRVETTTVAAVEIAPVTGAETTTPFRKESRNVLGNIETSSSDVEAIVKALASQVDFADEAAAKRIWDRCRECCSDATTGEVEAVIQEKATIMRNMKQVASPMGFLIRTVPGVFAGEGIREHRRRVAEAARLADERKQQEFEAARERIQSLHRDRLRRLEILNDPAASEAIKTRAREWLHWIDEELNLEAKA